jgi:protein-disulfide isomerase
MSLKDHINDALNATTPDNETRRETYREILSAAGDDNSDAGIVNVVTRIITERERKAGSYVLAGHTDMAKREREEIGALRALLRQGPLPTEPTTPTAAPKTEPAQAAAVEAEKKPLFSRPQAVVAAAVAGVLILAVGIWFWIGSGNREAGTDAAAHQNIFTYPDDHAVGDPKAPVVLVEYAAPACPHCSHFFVTVFPTMKKEYIDTGKIYYIFRVFPIMAADGAAEAIARCLPEDKYFQFLDLLFRNQEKWDPEYKVTDVRGGLVRLSRIAGLNAAQVDSCIADPKIQGRINTIAKDATDKFDLQAVPAFIVDGTFWRSGGVTWPELKEKLDAQLAKKK